MAATFGKKRARFATPDPVVRGRLSILVDQKQLLLPTLDPTRRERTFSSAVRR